MAKRRSPAGSVDRLGTNHYRVRCTLGYDTEGKQVRISKTVRCSEREAYELRDRLLREAGKASTYAYAKMSVYRFVRDEWLSTRELAPTTMRGYESTLRNHIKPHFEHVMMKDVSTLYISKVLRGIEKPGAALNVYKMLQSAFNLAVDSNIMETNPMRKSMRPELEDYEADSYSIEELAGVLEFVRGHTIEPGILLAATCGLRASETCAVDWTDLILERLVLEDGRVMFLGSVDVYEGYHRIQGERVTTKTKTRRSKRVVALPALAVERLLELRGDGRIGPLMMDATGQRMTPDGFTSRWRRLMLPRTSKAGKVIYQAPVRYVELKNLRHSQSTILLELGATMHEVSQRDGHSRESTTDMFYNRARLRSADHDVAARLDQGLVAEFDRRRRRV